MALARSRPVLAAPGRLSVVLGARALSGQGKQSFIAKAAKEGPKSLLGSFHAFGGRFDDCLRQATIDRMDPGDVQLSLTVEESHANGYGTLHGGLIAALVDVVGTLALLSQDQHRGGVSLDINVAYMAAASVGDRVVCKGSLLRSGKSFGFAQVDIFRESDGKLLATGRHTKAFSPAASAGSGGGGKPSPSSS